MPKYKVLSPVILGGVIVHDGEIEVDEKKGASLVERGVLEEIESQEEEKPSRGRRKKDAEGEEDADPTPEG